MKGCRFSAAFLLNFLLGQFWNVPITQYWDKPENQIYNPIKTPLLSLFISGHIVFNFTISHFANKDTIS